MTVSREGTNSVTILTTRDCQLLFSLVFAPKLMALLASKQAYLRLPLLFGDTKFHGSPEAANSFISFEVGTLRIFARLPFRKFAVGLASCFERKQQFNFWVKLQLL